MQCSSCGKSGFVSVGVKRYCSNCGTAITSDTPIKGMSDIRPANQSSPHAAAAAPISKEPNSQTVPVITAPKPAGQFHGKQVGSGIIDLRATSLPNLKIDTPAQAVPVALKNDTSDAVPAGPGPGPVVTPTTSRPLPNPVNQPPIVATPALRTDRVAERLQKAATFTKHPMVNKFSSKPSVQKVAEPNNPLPNMVATHVDAMGQKAAVLQPRAAELQNALSAAKPGKFNIATVASGAAIIAIMGGYIWTQNYPKMAFHSAATKAGFSATLPSYVPSSYRQASPTSYRPGEISISFTSPGINDPLNIVQRRTDWDSNSLRENFVAKQSETYTAVQGQGLTIYLFGKNQASWVNHGVWYSISGADKLNREQILKIAYGL